MTLIFFIHIDLDSISHKESPRVHFTLAHELGHVLISEHRLGLLTRQLEPHRSYFLLDDAKSTIENEADFFASCLLMPEVNFKQVSAKFSKPFPVQSIKKIAAHFNISVLSTLIRFVDYGPYPIFVAFFKGTNITWYAMSDDFPKWAFKFKVHKQSPSDTILGDYV